MMLSNEVRELYRRRYINRLSMFRKRILTDIVLIITTGAFGENSPQYKGITFDGKKHFRFIGHTRGYSTFQIPPAVYDKIKKFVCTDEKSHNPTIEGGANAKLRMLRYAARELRIDEECLVFSGHKRAIYVAPLAFNWREFLHGKTKRIEYYNLPLKELIEEWKSRWLVKRIRSDHVKAQVDLFQPEQFRLSRFIGIAEDGR